MGEQERGLLYLLCASTFSTLFRSAASSLMSGTASAGGVLCTRCLVLGPAYGAGPPVSLDAPLFPGEDPWLLPAAPASSIQDVRSIGSSLALREVLLGNTVVGLVCEDIRSGLP